MSSEPAAKGSMSFEMKLLLAYHFTMMVLFAAGESMPRALQRGIAGGFLGGSGAALGVPRAVHGGRWPRIGPGRVLATFGQLAVGGFFLWAVAGRSGFAVSPRYFPWLAAGVGIVLYGALAALGLVYRSREAFLAHCGSSPVEGADAAPGLVAWKRLLKSGYSVLFLVVWLSFVARAAGPARVLPGDRSTATSERTAVVDDGGQVVHVTPVEKRAIELVDDNADRAIPVVIVLGCVLQFALGVPLFQRKPEDP